MSFETEIPKDTGEGQDQVKIFKVFNFSLTVTHCMQVRRSMPCCSFTKVDVYILYYTSIFSIYSKGLRSHFFKLQVQAFPKSGLSCSTFQEYFTNFAILPPSLK